MVFSGQSSKQCKKDACLKVLYMSLDVLSLTVQKLQKYQGLRESFSETKVGLSIQYSVLFGFSIQYSMLFGLSIQYSVLLSVIHYRVTFVTAS